MYAEVKDNAETLGAVATKKFTVGAGKRWLVYGGYVERDRGAALDIAFYNSSDKLIFAFTQVASGATNISWGVVYTASAQQLAEVVPLDTGSYVKYTWSIAQVTPEVTCLVIEHPV
jgi:hypothetical protein